MFFVLWQNLLLVCEKFNRTLYRLIIYSVDVNDPIHVSKFVLVHRQHTLSNRFSDWQYFASNNKENASIGGQVLQIFTIPKYNGEKLKEKKKML